MSNFDLDADRDAALRALAPMREPLAVAGRDEQEEALRARVVGALQAQVGALPIELDGRRRQRRLIAVSAGAALAAAAAAAIAWLPRGSEGTDETLAASSSGVRVEAIDAAESVDKAPATWIDEAGHTHALSVSAAALPAGTLELRANDTAPRLRTAQGVHVKLSPRARLRVTSARAEEGAELRLLEGEVACEVPKLGATRQFAINAPGARVIVHGTRFSVRAEGGMTCVRVTEGLVAVHPEASDAEVERLGPGESWGCEAEDRDRREARARRAKPRVARVPERSEPAPLSAAPTGTLDMQNRLLAEALRAERQDDRARAHHLFSELLEQHPGSPLTVEAKAGLARTAP